MMVEVRNGSDQKEIKEAAPNETQENGAMRESLKNQKEIDEDGRSLKETKKEKEGRVSENRKDERNKETKAQRVQLVKMASMLLATELD